MRRLLSIGERIRPNIIFLLQQFSFGQTNCLSFRCGFYFLLVTSSRNRLTYFFHFLIFFHVFHFFLFCRIQIARRLGDHYYFRVSIYRLFRFVYACGAPRTSLFNNNNNNRRPSRYCVYCMKFVPIDDESDCFKQQRYNGETGKKSF